MTVQMNFKPSLIMSMVFLVLNRLVVTQPSYCIIFPYAQKFSTSSSEGAIIIKNYIRPLCELLFGRDGKS
jgi:hypothetical protein